MPVLLVIKALAQMSDRAIFEAVMQKHHTVGASAGLNGGVSSSASAGAGSRVRRQRAVLQQQQQRKIRAALQEQLHALLQADARTGTTPYRRDKCLAKIGSLFRVQLKEYCPDRWSDNAVGAELLRRFVLVHLTNSTDKARLLLLMLRKLLLFASGFVTEVNGASSKCAHL